MSNIALQTERLSAGSVEVSSNVIFDSTLFSAGVNTADAEPINFRSQNLTGFTLGQNIGTSDNIRLTPWLSAC